MSLMCDKCSKQYDQINSLKLHLKTCSGTENDSKSIRCPECKITFGNIDMLRNHLESSHDVKLQYEKFSFKTLSEFLDWKINMEEATDCHYFIKASALYNSTKRTHLMCNRSGSASCRRSTGVRRPKSIKMDSTCPSSVLVIENESGINATFCKTHFGHGSSLQRCLTDHEREIIAGKMANGISMEEILDQVNEITSNMDDVKIMTTKEDLLNIRRDFNGRINSNHQQAQLMKNKMKVVKISDSTWIVKSTFGHNYVTQEKTDCDLNDCILRCRHCNVCTHMFVCDCPDQSKRTNFYICKHIHACRIVKSTPYNYRRSIYKSTKGGNVRNEVQSDTSEEKHQKVMIYYATKNGCNKMDVFE